MSMTIRNIQLDRDKMNWFMKAVNTNTQLYLALYTDSIRTEIPCARIPVILKQKVFSAYNTGRIDFPTIDEKYNIGCVALYDVPTGGNIICYGECVEKNLFTGDKLIFEKGDFSVSLTPPFIPSIKRFWKIIWK